MKNKGFTLVEMLVAIVILGLLAVFATSNILGMVERNKNKTNEMIINNLKDAAVSYGVSKIFLTTCNVGFEPRDGNLEDKTNCTFAVSVNDLISGGFFKDGNNSCKRDVNVIIYNYVDTNGNTEYRAYIPDKTCNS